MRGLGLRVKEAATIRVEHFKKEEQGWKVNIAKGTGITKGGRFRYLDVPKSFERELERMLYGKSPGEQLVSIKLDTIRQSVSKGLKKAGIVQKGRGCHGFRHAFARERVADLMKDRGLNEKGYTMLQRVLENRVEGKLANYGIFREEDKRLFEQVRQVINVVHGEIGHGNDRWDLAEVYMKQ